MIDLILFILCVFSIVFSVMVIISKNPIYSILYLIFVFCTVTFIFIILGIEFVAITFLIVYVGAIAVLFLFVVMMLNIKILEFDEVLWRYFPVGLFISTIFLFQIFSLLFRFDISNLFFFDQFFYVQRVDIAVPSCKPLFDDLFVNGLNYISVSSVSYNETLLFTENENKTFFVFTRFLSDYGDSTNLVWELTNTEVVGWLLYTYFFFTFIVVSLILLVAMIGSIVLVLNQNINIKRQLIFKQTLRELKSSFSLKK